MQYALVGNKRVEATAGAKGICTGCGSALIAKCGTKVVHHWAHAKKKDCDPWWENETEWHRNWKALFPEECREVVHRDENGEIHRVDIKTSSGTFIEIQHSAITDVERLSREQFYKNLVWIVDGQPFFDNFRICHPLPAPDSEIAQDLVWHKAEWGMLGTMGGMAFKRSENLEADGLVLMADRRELDREIPKTYRGHHQYVWKKPRSTWLAATVPVYIDFGGSCLFRLELYGGYLPALCRVSKAQFIEDCQKKNRDEN
ncbi:competence protein CoiA [Bdellovibrio bacteriovorus]|uniref:competence protein CoiA n=1 Tax=Bdellovibrio bacteriovorus TaxID=959 RepID=UPI0035A6D60A